MQIHRILGGTGESAFVDEPLSDDTKQDCDSVSNSVTSSVFGSNTNVSAFPSNCDNGTAVLRPTVSSQSLNDAPLDANRSGVGDGASRIARNVSFASDVSTGKVASTPAGDSAASQDNTQRFRQFSSYKMLLPSSK